MTKKHPKLNDLHLILLSTASQRDDGNLLPLPESASSDKDRIDRAIAVLIAGKFVEETEAEDALHVWRESADRRFGVAISALGRDAIGAGESATPEVAADVARISDTPADEQETPVASAPRIGSKQALLVEMLGREGGATIDELIVATNWLPHTTRAAISGLRKRGMDVTNARIDGVSRYRLVTPA